MPTNIARIGLEINFSSVCGETNYCVVHLHFEQFSLLRLSVCHRLTHKYIILLEDTSFLALLIEYVWPSWGIKVLQVRPLIAPKHCDYLIQDSGKTQE